MKTLSWRIILLLGVVSALSMGGYLLASHFTYRIGFPLDDAWIHQTYARNLAAGREWSFTPGKISGGSTSPLWSALLAVGRIFGSGAYTWTYLLGWFSLWGISIAGTGMFRKIYPEGTRYSIWVGVFLSLEWHLAWLAGSGMETLLFALAAALVLSLLLDSEDKKRGWGFVGILTGLSVWLRPDGITLLGPAFMTLLFSSRNWKTKMREGAWLAAGFFMLFILYLGFNQTIAGHWWPNTFFAKQAEYTELQNIPFWMRLWREFKLPLVGSGVTLLPGVLLSIWDMIRRKRWDLLALFLWISGYLVLYAWRLPVTYQHGRYVMPMMPVYFVFGFVGLAKWFWKPHQSKLEWAIKLSWTSSVYLVLALFWVLGAQAYGRDVAVIESEMVAVADWIKHNTPQDAVIAVHDIGAVGYFGDRTLLDLAGLISPDVIAFIRDEQRLGDYLDAQQADYLVTFPDWYPDLVKRSTLIFQTTGQFSPELGGENMAVYRWGTP